VWVTEPQPKPVRVAGPYRPEPFLTRVRNRPCGGAASRVSQRVDRIDTYGAIGWDDVLDRCDEEQDAFRGEPCNRICDADAVQRAGHAARRRGAEQTAGDEAGDREADVGGDVGPSSSGDSVRPRRASTPSTWT
jgi:hypothetical protein